MKSKTSRPIPWAKRLNIKAVPLPGSKLATVVSLYSEKLTSDFYLVGQASLTPDMVQKLIVSLQSVVKKHPEAFAKKKKRKK